jgi:hypothetical protein
MTGCQALAGPAVAVTARFPNVMVGEPASEAERCGTLMTLGTGDVPLATRDARAQGTTVIVVT